MRFSVRISQTPDGHWQALKEAAFSVASSLRKLGHETGGSLEDSRLIAFNAHINPTAPITDDAIIYNSEQIPIDLAAPPPHVPATHHEQWRAWWGVYLALLRAHVVWDYSEENIARLRKHGIARAVLCPLGYVEELATIKPAATFDIDVLFFGSINERRRQALRAIRDRGFVVKALFGAYGDARDAAIARSKLILNLHFYDKPIWEIFRCSYLLINGCCVVSEDGGHDEQLEALARDTTAYASYDNLVDTCASLLIDDSKRQENAARGKAAFQSRDQVEYVRAALEASL